MNGGVVFLQTFLFIRLLSLRKHTFYTAFNDAVKQCVELHIAPPEGLFARLLVRCSDKVGDCLHLLCRLVVLC